MRVIPIVIALAFVTISAAQAEVPRALYGKSIVVSWLETRSQRDGEGLPFKPVGLPYTSTFYISSQGRLFHRTTTTSRGGTGSKDIAGTGGKGTNEARNVSFSGNRVIARASFEGAARQTQISFDPGFANCTAQVITAFPKGAKTAVVRSITTGRNVEFESVSAGAASCSITNGNPF